MPVFGLKIRVWWEFDGQNIFSGLDARGGYGHKDFFSDNLLFYFWRPQDGYGLVEKKERKT